MIYIKKLILLILENQHPLKYCLNFFFGASLKDCYTNLDTITNMHHEIYITCRLLLTLVLILKTNLDTITNRHHDPFLM